MKLWVKIFLSILVLSLSTLTISITYIINENHIISMNREKERDLGEFELIATSLSNSLDFSGASTDTLTVIMDRYGDYYKSRGIYLGLYKDSKYVYNNFSSVKLDSYKKLLSVKKKEKIAQVIHSTSNDYILISKQMYDNVILLYARDISEIYTAKNNSITLYSIMLIILTCFLGVFSYLCSKWITRPLNALHKGVMAVSTGKYDISLSEHDKEFRDVANAFNQMARDVKDRTQELEERAKELQTFIDDLSHEMNTPLTSIQGYSSFLLSANASEEQKRTAAMYIHSESKRIRDMYSKLMVLSFAREHNIERQKYFCEEMVEELRQTFYHELMNQKINVTKEILVDYLMVDRTLFHMLLSNLVKNSIQAMDMGGHIHIKIYCQNNISKVIIQDSGMGIPEDKLEKVTKPFYRIDKSRSRKTGGAGLGLSICSKIVALHGGSIEILSTLGEGTTIIITLND
ncbi:sensor histidine kinase [Anaeromicropila herbilytica]|uniref:histidine kinase n=1 Tax=Anaeromicropila herbilytica TaxID=2785025 RepID=A0A7R7IEH5_9FIRM|nr:HAMP domain-containing sensor histidine kinase [Anaeromicropila herbilytica]BCN32718.1 two-component sensor histidine kinase [Anaeromicropila herbilytica]